MNKEKYEKLKGHTLRYKNYKQDHEDTFHNTLLIALKKEALSNATFIHSSYKFCRSNAAREAVYQERFDGYFVECFMKDTISSRPDLWLDFKKAYVKISEHVYKNYKGSQSEAFVRVYLNQEDTTAIAQKLNTSNSTVLVLAGKIKREVVQVESLKPYLEIIGLSRRYNLTAS